MVYGYLAGHPWLGSASGFGVDAALCEARGVLLQGLGIVDPVNGIFYSTILMMP